MARKYDKIISQMADAKRTVDQAIENDAKGELPGNLPELPPDRRDIEVLVWLFWRKDRDPPTLDEEFIKEILARMDKSDLHGHGDWRRIKAAFGEGRRRHGKQRVDKLRRQYDKTQLRQREIDQSS